MSGLLTFARSAGLRLRTIALHEWTLACLAALAVGVFVNRGALADPMHTLPQDVWDPSIEAYLLAWVGHAVLHDPTHLWQLNSFYPTHLSLAFDDSLLGYSPFGFFGTGTAAATLRYNIVFTFAFALAFLGAYALVRQLGANRLGGAVAGLVFATAPWRLAHGGHLNVISTGGMALCMAMLARGHGLALARRTLERTKFRPGWALAGWLVAAWQVTLGFAVGLPFVYVLGGFVLGAAAWWFIAEKPLPSRRLLIMDLVGGLIFGAVTILMALPYLRVLKMYPSAARGEADVALFSPNLHGYVTASAENWFWGDWDSTVRATFPVPGEQSVLPGMALYVMAIVGLAFSVWSLQARLWMLAGVIFSIVLGLGTNGPGQGAIYLFLLHHLPGFQGLRTPGRLVLWTTFGLMLLAAGMLTALTDKVRAAVRDDPKRWHATARLALLLPLLVVFIEDIGTTPHPIIDSKPVSLSMVEAPYMVLPSDVGWDMHVIFWSTDGFPTIVNGSSSFNPPDTDTIRSSVADFPSAASIAYLRHLGIKSVVIFPWEANSDSPWSDTNKLIAPIDGVRQEVAPDGAVIFHLT
jgi:hypothetical protein